MAGVNKIINPGFGVGSYFGTAVTVALAETSTTTLTGSSYPTGMTILSAARGVNVNAGSAANGITETVTILEGYGFFMNDGASCRLVNTTTSVTVRLYAP